MANCIDIDELVNLRQAARELDITLHWLYTLIKRGQISVTRVAGYQTVARAELERWQAKREADKAAAQAVAA